MTKDEILMFWNETRAAWAKGELSDLSSKTQEIARSQMTIEQFIDNSTELNSILSRIDYQINERLYAYIIPSYDILLTSHRLLVRNRNKKIHDIYTLEEISTYKESGWLRTKSVFITLVNGTKHTYSKLGGAIRSEYMLFAISRSHQARSASQSENEKSKHSERDALDESMPKTEAECARVLGINGDVTPEVARQRWRDLTKQYHPDQVQNLGEKLKLLAENEMKRINAAYEFFRKK